MYKISIMLAVIMLSISLNAQQNPVSDHSILNISCKTCHTCDVPTKKDPCLIMCPREKIVTVYQKPEETPELIVIDQIEERYGEVYFAHKIHAQMSVMSGGCENCHHHNTSGPILQCNNCHEPSRKREDVSLPDLKAAYHRQCMDCHREWSHETGCNSCHSPVTDVKESQKEKLEKELSGVDHPPLEEPTRIVYETDYNKGKLVTFFHDDHSKKFDIDCISCHKQESCTKCHDVNKTNGDKSKIVKVKKSLEEHHKQCFSCHEDDKCSNCHLDKQPNPFNHFSKTGWALNKYHVNLSCAKCHGSKLPYKKIDSKCSSCHKDWDNDNFKHSVTGLQLDETHSEFSCEDCHIDNNYAVKPGCDNCHDDYVFPNEKPGEIVKK